MPNSLTRRAALRGTSAGRVKAQTRFDRITTTIKREWLAKIVDGTKRTEYRAIKKYWTVRLNRVRVPFELRLINGYQSNAPEVTVLIDRVRKNLRERLYELHIGKILSIRYWNAVLQRPR